MIKLLVATGFVALNAYVYYWMAQEKVVPPRESFASFPLELGEWECAERQFISADVLRNLGATDYLICDYRREDGAASHVGVYIGYHATQIREQGGGAGENSIHPPAHCLPGSGWDIIANRTVTLDLPGFPEPNPRVKRLVIAKGQVRQLVYYWYQSAGRVIAEDWKKIVYVGWDRATRGRTDGSLVRFTVPIVRGDVERAERAFRALAPRVVADLGRFVPV
jgi:EpsI family protein